MLSTKYHFVSIAAIFFALGIGILIGGTLGQGWVNEVEQSVVKQLEGQIDSQLDTNEQLRQQLYSLQLMVRKMNEGSHQGKIVWVRTGGDHHVLLSFLLDVVGAERLESYNLEVDGTNWLDHLYHDKQNAKNDSTVHVILADDTAALDAVKDALTNLLPLDTDLWPVLVDISEHVNEWEDPETLVHFVIQICRIGQEGAGNHHASIHLNRHSSME